MIDLANLIRSAKQESGDVEILHTSESSFIAKDSAGTLYEAKYLQQGDEYFVGEPQEITEAEYREKTGEPCELTGPIVSKNMEKRIAYAAVLVPGEPDSDGEIVSKEKIEEAAHEWMKSYRNVDLQHSLNNVAVPVESYIIPTDMQFGDYALPQGTWVLASKIFDDETWNRVKSGELTGYSVMGIKRTTMESANKNADLALKRTLLADLGADWIAAAVSIVDEPAVPKAKFFAIKESGATTQAQKTTWDKIKDFASGKVGRTISEKNFQKLQEADSKIAEGEGLLRDVIGVAEQERTEKEHQQEGSEMNTEEIKELVGQMLDERLATATEEPEAKEASAEVEAEETVEAKESTEAESSEVKEPEVDLTQELSERLEKIEAYIAKAASPRSVKGQDGEEETYKSALKGRDSFGRRIDK